MSRFLDNPDPGETLPLFPDHWSYSTYKLALGLEVFAFLLSTGNPPPTAPPRFPVDTFLAGVSLLGATVPFFFADAAWLTRIRYAFTGGLFWSLMLIPLGIIGLYLVGRN
jgi:hypothetical protein